MDFGAESKRPGLAVFAGVLGTIFALRLVLAFVRAPESIALLATIIVTALFVMGPILALYSASAWNWTAGKAGAFLATGVIAHAAGIFGVRAGLAPFPAAVMEAVGQTGIVLWCLGLGVLIALLVKDRNLLIPIAIFLAGFDAFLILTPTSLPQRIIQTRPEVFTAVAVKIPGVNIGPAAYIGPADLFFLSMFFFVLHRYQMRTAQTLKWMIPVLVGYLFVVLFLGGVQLGPISLATLPALVPIGAVILIINRDQFKMTTDERMATAVVAVMALALAGFGFRNAMTHRAGQASPAAPSPSVRAQVPPK